MSSKSALRRHDSSSAAGRPGASWSFPRICATICIGVTPDQRGTTSSIPTGESSPMDLRREEVLTQGSAFKEETMLEALRERLEALTLTLEDLLDRL